ncbi:sensor histidine kinase [Radiobacillus sp. PE A8.2]|uniref:cache domain-containing sensor histidine kinase n=1 Tax=Radiobacillus sp. PE A8.2 TaxID=3380349 RepID=UPI00388DAD5D
MFLLLIIIIFPIGASTVLNHYQTRSSIEERSIQENANLLSQGRMNVESYLKAVNQLSVSVYSNTNLLNMMRSDNSDDYFLSTNEITRTIVDLLYSNEGIEQVFLYAHNQKQAYALSHTTEFKAKKLDINNWTYDRELENDQILIEPPHPLHGYSLSGTDRQSAKSVLSFHRALYDIPLRDFIGYLIFDINIDQINKMVEDLYIQGSEDLYLLTNNNAVIYSSDGKREMSADHDWLQKIDDSDSDSDVFEWEDKEGKYFIFYEKLPENLGGLLIVKKTPHNFLFESINEILLTNIIIAGLALIFVIGAATFVSFKITKPIKVLANNMERIGTGDFSVEYDSLGKDEIGQLGDRFKQMVKLLNNYIEQVYEWELKNKNNQLRILQSQINPHFLYNSLQTIGTLALKSNKKSIYQLLNTLAQIMRYSINYKEDYVTLDKEFKYAKSYLKLQKQRFGDKFKYDLDLEDSVKEYKVPKMLLQPLIENYFKHGFNNGDGEIQICGKEKQTDLVIEISDNSGKLTDKVIERINYILHSDDDNLLNREEGRGIGLYNVVSRIRIFYGDQFSIIPLMNKDRGLTIRIIIFSHDKGEDIP